MNEPVGDLIIRLRSPREPDVFVYDVKSYEPVGVIARRFAKRCGYTDSPGATLTGPDEKVIDPKLRIGSVNRAWLGGCGPDSGYFLGSIFDLCPMGEGAADPRGTGGACSR